MLYVGPTGYVSRLGTGLGADRPIIGTLQPQDLPIDTGELSPENYSQELRVLRNGVLRREIGSVEDALRQYPEPLGYRHSSKSCHD